MDAIELARQIAAELHTRAVSAGQNPWDAYTFAVAEANRRGLDVEPIAPDAGLLDGGRAIFIAADGLILHANNGTPFEQAFLVAHEIGHHELGDDGGAEPAREIDPARSTEPSPIGVDRVIDYGRRQRREVQMDLFAREFLLPRPVVRRLHVEENLSASVIAERAGAPFEVVAQQLFDALLLPPLSRFSEAVQADREREPNALQVAAAAHRGPAYLLEAGPGTGKTQTLSLRVKGLLEDGVDPRQILLLTFSNKAAGEMADRIALIDQHAAAAMWIGTFHAFGLDLIRRFYAELGLPHDPRMMDRTEAVELLEQEFPRLGFEHYRNIYDPTQIIADMLAAISRAKDEVVDEVQYAELAATMRRVATTPEARETAERALEVAQTYAAYENLKRQAHCIDFGDLVSLPVRLLEDNAAIRAHLQSQYDHVLVDEYQDVNRASVRLLTALRGAGENLWAVGDAKQSIYRFRGASSFNMARFGGADFASGKRGQLKRNYRSVEEIVAAYSSFAAQMATSRHAGALESHRGRGGHRPVLRTVVRAEQEPVALVEAIEEMRARGYSYSAQAVLCTGNERLAELAQDLERSGVPVLFLGSLFERPEVKDLLCLLSLLIDRRAMGLIRMACWSEFAMSMADVAQVLDYLRGVDTKPAAWLGETEAITGVSEQGHSALRALARALDGFNQSASPWATLASVLLDRTRIAADIAASTDIATRARGIAIWQLMNFIRVQPSGRGPPILRLLDRVRRLVRLGDDRDLRQLPAAAQGIDAVRLMTIHGAKGLEFPVVHMPGLNADTIPRSSIPPACPIPDGMVVGSEGSALEVLRAAHAEEQECLFYVALSRARDRLFLYAPTQKSNGHRRPLSPFLDRLGSTLDRDEVTPARSLPDAPEAQPIELRIDGMLRFSASQISLYEACPRRFFYTHVLQVGGRRTTTAFMQMHDAVRSVFQSIIAEGLHLPDADDLDRRLDAAFAAHKLDEHGYAEDLKAFAVGMSRFFISTRQSHVPQAPTALNLKFVDEEIIVRPDDVLVRPDGRRTFRRIQTGHLRSTESKDVAAAAFLLAARQAFPDAVVELVHLADEQVRPIQLSTTEIQGRHRKLTSFLGEIRAGHFPARPSPRSCPACPAFFICGATPPGTLTKKF